MKSGSPLGIGIMDCAQFSHNNSIVTLQGGENRCLDGQFFEYLPKLAARLVLGRVTILRLQSIAGDLAHYGLGIFMMPSFT